MSRNGVEIAANGKRIVVSDCKHCEHLTAYWEDTSGKHKRWQCCHCGRIRDEYAPVGVVWRSARRGCAVLSKRS